MWEVDNATPFAAAYSWVRDRDGADCWIVAVRGTFLIAPDGSTSLSDEQSDVCAEPKYVGEPGQSSLVYDSDLLPSKPTTDITLLGHAYAPAGTFAKQLDVTLRISSLSKTLRVFGDRQWVEGPLGLSITEPEPFEKMPIVYERAFGGGYRSRRAQAWETRNPVGCGYAVDPDNLAPQHLPNIEYPQDLISSWRQRPSPAGFGPIPPHWSPRNKWAGTYDAKWERERQPLVAEDFDERFYLAAPEDQQPPTHLRGGEAVELINLTRHGHLRCLLPSVILGFETHFYTNEVVRHRSVLHSVILEPDVPRVIMVWSTILPCHGKALKLDRTRVVAKQQRQRLAS